ncbi:MAG: TetR/AcrR family transcriptional regulator [Candidatus Dadabacteria bacterium]|nr:TetR/AcrR family transcriptional regulator [Candidatus Dadabacteria bacterium]MCZ6685520.1 TetR/AcrR family transcriptional regulator [Candidatus Dadabacteria bacterium]
MAKPKKLMDKKVAPSQKRIRRKSRKEEIIKAASNLFSQKSYHDVTMDQIAGEVGVAKGTIYLYFKSKENLYLGILEHTFETIESILEKEIAKEDPAPQKLKKILRLIFQFYFQNMDVLRILTRDETRLIREHFEFTEHWRHRRIKLYRKVLEKGIKEGSFRSANTELMALIIFGLVGSVMFFYPTDKTAGEIAEEVFSMISEGIMTTQDESTLAVRGL